MKRNISIMNVVMVERQNIQIAKIASWKLEQTWKNTLYTNLFSLIHYCNLSFPEFREISILSWKSTRQFISVEKVINILYSTVCINWWIFIIGSICIWEYKCRGFFVFAKIKRLTDGGKKWNLWKLTPYQMSVLRCPSNSFQNVIS